MWSPSWKLQLLLCYISSIPGVFGLFIQMFCIYVLFFFAFQLRRFFVFLNQTDSALRCSRGKNILRQEAISCMVRESACTYITSGSCISSGLKHCNEHIMCWDETRVGKHKFGLKNKSFCRKYVANLCAWKVHVWYLHENQQIHPRLSFRLLSLCMIWNPVEPTEAVS